MSSDSTRWAPHSKAEKALLLWTLIGMEEADLDVLLKLCQAPAAAAPEGRDRAGPPVEDAADGPYSMDLLCEVVAAYPDCTVSALVAHPSVRLPGGLRRSDLPHLTLTARVVLRARQALQALAARCEGAGISVLQSLDRLAMCVAPQLHATVDLDPTHEPAFRSLLDYQQRRCDARGSVLSVRAARQATVQRTVAKVRP